MSKLKQYFSSQNLFKHFIILSRVKLINSKITYFDVRYLTIISQKPMGGGTNGI